MIRIMNKMIVLLLVCCSTVSIVLCHEKATITLDEFSNATEFTSVSFSPSGEYLLIQNRKPSWNTNSFDHQLWIYTLETEETKLITNKLNPQAKPLWSPNGSELALLIDSTVQYHSEKQSRYYIHIYSVVTSKLVSVPVDQYPSFGLAWGKDNCSLFFTAISVAPLDQNNEEWKDVIEHRSLEMRTGTKIYQLHFCRNDSPATDMITTVPLIVGELLFVPRIDQLIITSVAKVIEHIETIEIYGIDLANTSIMHRLTTNEAIEHDLKLSMDGLHIFFRSFELGSDQFKYSQTVERVFSLNLASQTITRLASDFQGSIVSYSIHPEHLVLFIGQMGTETIIYTQSGSTHESVQRRSWNGSFVHIAVPRETSSVAFIHSSFDRPKEVYLADNLEQLSTARAITHDNEFFIKRQLPSGKVYRWKNSIDNRTIEGILRYPPGKQTIKNLPMLVLIHGGLYAASTNSFHVDFENWGVLAASEGWLVFEPNYRGSTGYGHSFVNEVRYDFISRPADDILSGVDQLIREGIADSNRLAIGGYSYGAYLTNWIISQTTKFKAALSGAGAVEHVSGWGITDLPVFTQYLAGGKPWEKPEIYQRQAPIYQVANIKTPTHLVTGGNDERVSPMQSYTLERALNYLGIPVKLLVFPNEGHSMNNNPWHGKIKLREELKWLSKYVAR